MAPIDCPMKQKQRNLGKYRPMTMKKKRKKKTTDRDHLELLSRFLPLSTGVYVEDSAGSRKAVQCGRHLSTVRLRSNIR